VGCGGFADRVLSVVGGMQMVGISKVRVMSCLLVVAFAVVPCRFAMVVRCLPAMVRTCSDVACLLVVFVY